MTYVKSLSFAQKPDYKMLRCLFRTLFIRSNFKFDDLYDWEVQEQNTQGRRRREFRELQK